MREGEPSFRFSAMASFILAATVVLSSASGFAQRPPVAPLNLTYLRIDFIHPSARPAALGGAFIGAAQDESAGPVNPAGLTYLKSAGAALNQRHVRSKFDEPEGSPTNPDAQTRFQTIDFDQTMVNIFIPFKKITFAAFRQVAFDSRFNLETRQFLTTTASLTTRQALGGLGNFPGKKVDLDLQMVNDAVAVAIEIHKRLSFGFSIKTSVLNFKIDELTFLDPEVENGTPPRDNLAETVYSISALDERNVQPSFSFGVMSKLVSDKFFLGAVLNLNPKFNLRSNIFLPEYSLSSQSFAAEFVDNTKFKIPVPDTYGLGFYYIATPRLRFTFDVLRVEYTDMLSGNDLNAVEDDELNLETGAYEDPDGEPDLTIEDAIELHFGLEYLFRVPKLGLIPLRFGLYNNPGHRIHAANDTPDLKRLFPEAQDRIHFTFGGGLVINSYLKFDASFNVSADIFEFIGTALISVPF